MMSSNKVENSGVRPRRWIRFLLSVFVLIAIAAAIAHFSWKYSGSGEWVLESDKNGIAIYSMKVPGSTVKKIKAVTRVKTTMQRAVSAMRDTSIAACAQWVPGCVSQKPVEPWASADLSYVHLFRVDLPSPLSPREFLLETKFVPEPSRKSVLVEVSAEPDAVPLNDCCFRVSHVNNSWRFTEKGINEVEVESIQDMDVGLPYFMLNYAGPHSIRAVFSKLPQIFNKPEYDAVVNEFMAPR
jgi:hypothetical protein